MGCTTNKAEDVIGCLHCHFYCNKCKKRVYACTSPVSCIHCGAYSKHFNQNLFNDFEGPALKNNHVEKRKIYDRCEWCHSSNSNLVKMVLDAIHEIKKKDTPPKPDYEKMTPGERNASIISRIEKINKMLDKDKTSTSQPSPPKPNHEKMTPAAAERYASISRRLKKIDKLLENDKMSPPVSNKWNAPGGPDMVGEQ